MTLPSSKISESHRSENQHHSPAFAPVQELEPAAPKEAKELYLADREQDLRASSLQTHESVLGFFESWCLKNGIKNLNDLSGRDLHRFRVWRREKAPTKTDKLSLHTEQTSQKILRQFLRYCVQIEAVQIGLPEKVQIPVVPDDERAKSETVDPDEAREIIDWLETYEYASLAHTTWVILADTGARISSIVALDLDDYRRAEDPPHLRVRDREGTHLKNGNRGERLVSLRPSTCDVIDDYLAHQREDLRDAVGREPLLTTSFGRVSKSTVRKNVYRWTRPCARGQSCPHGRDAEDCEPAQKAASASRCPSSKSPHTVRRGYITHALNAGVDQALIGEKCDVTPEILEAHYDARDEREKMEVRQQAFELARRDHESYGGR